jgi:glycerol uptake facilitator protein
MQAYLGEFIGTALLVLLGNGVVANVVLAKTKGSGAGWIVITFGWGMAVFVGVWCVGDISGAHLNPAVTIGLALANGFGHSEKFALSLAPGYIAAQMLGAIIGAAIVFLFYYDHYVASADADAKLGTFATSPAIRNYPINLFSEIVGTLVLVLAGLLAVDPAITSQTSAESATASGEMKMGLGALGALPTGLLVLAIGLSLGGTTGYAINPARDLGPRIAHALLPIPGKRDSDWAYAWVPVLGPMVGAVVAVLVWWALTSAVR